MPRRGQEELEPPSQDSSFYDDEALPPGIVFTDVLQKQWRIGKPIGRGSFGRIYLASDEIKEEVTKLNARYVVKIEPHSNGPLFVEVHCLIRTAQVAKVKAWRQQNKQKRLGIPVYIATGSFTEQNSGIRYRFLVLPRYDVDLQQVISRTKVLDLKNVLIVAIQILDALEFLHSQGYTHSDIKSSNLMIGFDGNKYNKANSITSTYQKDNKKLVLLTRKPKNTKSKSRTSNYYDDEDFIVRERSIVESPENNKRLDSVKKKLRRILSNKDNRTLHRHHAFNLRQLSNYVNYEDLNSSVCSDQSYQKLLDDFGSKYSPKVNVDTEYTNDDNSDEIHREAVLSQSNGQVYLLDYGLASKFVDAQGNHKDFGMDARKAHDGTLEYSSRDSHIGAHSRRSDLETLGYNLLDWLTGTLPWKTPEVLAEPDLVHILKKNFMADKKLLLKTCFKTEFYPQFLEKYLDYVTSLDFTEIPDYIYCKSLFQSELLKLGCVLEQQMNVKFTDPLRLSLKRKLHYSRKFSRKNTPSDFLTRNGITKPFERENLCSLENDLKLELLKQTLNNSSDGIRKPCTSRNFFISDAHLVARLKRTLMPHDIFGKKLSPKNLRSKKKETITKRKGVKRHRNSIGKFGKFMGSARQFTWAEILAGNPEDIIRKERNVSDDDDDSNCKYRIRKLSYTSENSESNPQSPLLQKDYLQHSNPTYAMKEVIANMKKRINGKIVKDDDVPPGLEGYTPAMISIYKIKKKREDMAIEELKKNCIKEFNVRCTRSMANKTKKTDVPPIKLETRSKSIKRKSNEETTKRQTESVENETNSPNKINRKTRNRAQKETKKEVKETIKEVKIYIKKEDQVEVPKATPKPAKKTTRSTAVPVNRRILRSSTRKKSSK